MPVKIISLKDLFQGNLKFDFLEVTESFYRKTIEGAHQIETFEKFGEGGSTIIFNNYKKGKYLISDHCSPSCPDQQCSYRRILDSEGNLVKIICVCLPLCDDRDPSGPGTLPKFPKCYLGISPGRAICVSNGCQCKMKMYRFQQFTYLKCACS